MAKDLIRLESITFSDIIMTCRAKDKDNPTSPGLKASFPNTAKIAENKMTRSPINSDHTPIHLQVTWWLCKLPKGIVTITIKMNPTAYNKTILLHIARWTKKITQTNKKVNSARVRIKLSEIKVRLCHYYLSLLCTYGNMPPEKEKSLGAVAAIKQMCLRIDWNVHICWLNAQKPVKSSRCVD